MLRKVFPLIVILLFLVPSINLSAIDKGEETIVCPVCGFIVEKSKASVREYDGKPYYFCDAGCKAYFIQNTDIVTSGKTMDPVCGIVFNREKAVTMVYGGRQIDFCSEKCRDMYQTDPGKYELNYDVVTHEVGRVREMKHRTDFEGRTYYFTSGESKKQFEKNPDAYIYAECPIGGDVFLRKDAFAKREYKDRTYYFGCKGCLMQFEKDPGKYSKLHSSSSKEGCKYQDEHKGCKYKEKHKSCKHSERQEGSL